MQNFVVFNDKETAANESFKKFFDKTPQKHHNQK